MCSVVLYMFGKLYRIFWVKLWNQTRTLLDSIPLYIVYNCLLDVWLTPSITISKLKFSWGTEPLDCFLRCKVEHGSLDYSKLWSLDFCKRFLRVLFFGVLIYFGLIMFRKLYKFSRLVMYLNSCSMDLDRDSVGIRVGSVIPCGLRDTTYKVSPNEDVRDLSGGDCDASIWLIVWCV